MRMLDNRTTRGTRIVAAWVTAIALGLVTASAVAADGDRDLGFGSGGVVKFDHPGTLDGFQAAAVQADSSILAAGITGFGGPQNPGGASDLLIGRFNANGSLIGGTRIENALVGQLTAVGVSGTGEIVIVGYDSTSGGAIRNQVRKFNASGEVLGSFAPPHFQTTFGIPTICQSKNVLFDVGGKILVPCYVQNRQNSLDYPAIVRLNSDMSLDNSFGNDFDPSTPELQRRGYAMGPSPDGPGSEGYPRGTVVAADGSGGYYLLVTNYDVDPRNEGEFGDIEPSIIVNHFLADGTLDTAYGTNGLARVASAAGQTNRTIEADSLFVDSMGRLLVGGSRFGPGSSTFLARLNPNGTPDTSFGVNGLVDPLVDDAAGGIVAFALFGDSASRLYVLNSRILTRLDSNGTVDGTFSRFPSNFPALYSPSEFNSRWTGAAVVDGGQRALLLGGVDQSRVVTDTPSSALSTLAKIELNSGPGPVRPVVNFSATSQTVNEGVGSAPVQINVSLSPVSAVDVTISFSFSGSAGGADYALPNGNSIVIPAGQTSGALAVRIIDDALDEKTETLNIALGTPTNATAGSSNFFALALDDNDSRPSVSFDRVSSVVAEGRQTTVVLQLSAPSAQTVSVSLSASGSATRDRDYRLHPANRTVVFKPGTTRKNIVIKAIDDAATERKEEIVLSLQVQTNAKLGAARKRSVFINDND